MQLDIPAYLVLENGAVFEGLSPKWVKDDRYGEVVFTTGMTGYPESLTDPSYSEQILIFTYPLIGNYGVPLSDDWESKKIHVNGIIVNEVCNDWNHHTGNNSLLQWVYDQHVPIIGEIDTRALTKLLRSSGTMAGVITTSRKKKYSFPNYEKISPVKTVSIDQPNHYKNGEKIVVVVDCGMKENIMRQLKSYPVTLVQVPFDYDFTNEHYDGVFLSNGPGDPSKCQSTIRIIEKALCKGKPMFGICLGSQLMALASGGKTYKLPFGHRGHNQPCMEIETKKCFITSQNHGYAVEEKSLGTEWKVSFRNLNDHSVEGIQHRTKPFFAVQFHPEAKPGPTDTSWLFNTFYRSL